MVREDRELLADLKRVCNQAGQFALAFIGGELSVEAEEAYAYALDDLAERILRHARARNGLVLNGEATSLVIEAGWVRVEPERLELPPGCASGHDRV